MSSELHDASSVDVCISDSIRVARVRSSSSMRTTFCALARTRPFPHLDQPHSCHRERHPDEIETVRQVAILHKLELKYPSNRQSGLDALSKSIRGIAIFRTAFAVESNQVEKSGFSNVKAKVGVAYLECAHLLMQKVIYKSAQVYVVSLTTRHQPSTAPSLPL
jgi:hypothetical protein